LECHAVGLAFEAPDGDRELLERYGEAGRFQCTATGEIVGDEEGDTPHLHSLCPSDPQNRGLLREAAVELVTNYHVSGIQLAGMEFLADPQTCFCEGCRERFQRHIGLTVSNWPQDVQQGGVHAAAWQQWRRDVLTTLVEEIADAVSAAGPSVFVSAAPISDVRAAYEQHGQDWTTWARAGAIDFVCATPYDNASGRVPLIEQQVAQLRGAVPLYAIVGDQGCTSVWSLIEEIEQARGGGADGFVVKVGSPETLLAWLPDLHTTLAANDPNPSPHGHPPARFAFGGEATAPPASASSVLAGASLEVELSVGWEPPALSTEDTEGAEAAGAMLERALNVRDPIDNYDERGPVVMSSEEDRLAGRIIIEAPDGNSLLIVGAFDSSYQFARTLKFSAPQGPFRVAVYGTLTTGAVVKDFVVRSPLLEGLSGDELTAASHRAEFEELRLRACTAPELAVFAEFAPVLLHFNGTGSPEGSFWVRFDDEGGCETGLGVPNDPDLTFTATIEDFVAAAHGTISADLLFDSGRLRVTGDGELLERLAAIFMDE
ncbi:MAG: family 10 glycosylhydrolase, partial [Armatimonadetes bacterium]|nr:family 10 glycosylhydrolase [Armatimonadota bacterium]